MKKKVFSALHRMRTRLFLSCQPFYQEMEAIISQCEPSKNMKDKCTDEQ